MNRLLASGSLALAVVAAVVLWAQESPPPTTRGVGLLGDKVFLAASDAVLMAFDVGTGRTVWSTTVADNSSGHYMSLAPLVADGKVLGQVAAYLAAKVMETA